MNLTAISDRQNGFGSIVGDFNAEFFLKSHDQLNGIERIGTQVINEACCFGDLASVNAEVLNYNLLYAVRLHRSCRNPQSFLFSPLG